MMKMMKMMKEEDRADRVHSRHETNETKRTKRTGEKQNGGRQDSRDPFCRQFFFFFPHLLFRFLAVEQAQHGCRTKQHL